MCYFIRLARVTSLKWDGTELLIYGQSGYKCNYMVSRGDSVLFSSASTRGNNGRSEGESGQRRSGLIISHVFAQGLVSCFKRNARWEGEHPFYDGPCLSYILFQLDRTPLPTARLRSSALLFGSALQYPFHFYFTHTFSLSNFVVTLETLIGVMNGFIII